MQKKRQNAKLRSLAEETTLLGEQPSEKEEVLPEEQTKKRSGGKKNPRLTRCLSSEERSQEVEGRSQQQTKQMMKLKRCQLPDMEAFRQATQTELIKASKGKLRKGRSMKKKE